jgi:hypothetical protein
MNPKNDPDNSWRSGPVFDNLPILVLTILNYLRELYNQSQIVDVLLLSCICQHIRRLGGGDLWC